MDTRDNQPAADPTQAAGKRPYAKPTVTSHRVFEVSLACIKVPGAIMCQMNIARNRS